MKQQLADIIAKAHGKNTTKRKFIARVEEGGLTRSENPLSHVCVYFAAVDKAAQHIFIGLHKKSGLWLCNGGHIDRNELPQDTVVREAQEEWGLTLATNSLPHCQLMTITKIEHPERQLCQWHYDLWFYIATDRRTFAPDPKALDTEFSAYGWKSLLEATRLMKDPASRESLAYLTNLL